MFNTPQSLLSKLLFLFSALCSRPHHAHSSGLPYLALASPDALPTSAQLKALQVLTYTFPLLPLMKHLPRPAPASSRPRAQQQPAPAAGAQVIRRFGINVRLGAAALPRVPEQGNEGRVLFDDEDPRAYFPPVPEFRFQFHLHLPPLLVFYCSFSSRYRAPLCCSTFLLLHASHYGLPVLLAGSAGKFT